MVAPTDDQLQTLLLREIGDDGTVEELLPTLWSLYEPWAVYTSLDGRLTLQYAKARVHAVQILMGSVWKKAVNAQEKDRRADLRGRFLNLQALLQEARNYVGELESINASTDSAAVGQLDVSLPNLDSPLGAPDPTDTLYSGDPNKPVGWWRVQP